MVELEANITFGTVDRRQAKYFAIEMSCFIDGFCLENRL